MPDEPTPTIPAEQAPGAGFQPAETLVIASLEQLKAISDPLRLNILEQIAEEALTVKQISTRLKQPVTKLYYHVAELEKGGFVTLVDTRVKSGIIEKYYRTSSKNITIDRSLLNAGDEDAVIPEMLAVIFDATMSEITTSIKSGLMDIQDVTTGSGGNVILLRTLFSLRRANLPQFLQKFQALLAEMEAESEQSGPDAVNYACTIAFYPRVAPQGPEQE